MADNLVTPETACLSLLSSIRRSNLHFIIQEFPFSLYVTLRKKFTSNPAATIITCPTQSPICESSVSTSTVELEAANASLEKKEIELANSYEIIQQIENKIECCEANFFKESNNLKQSKDVLKDEIKMLKESIKKGNIEHDNLKKNLSEGNKNVKFYEKENYNLQKRIENFTETIKHLKDNIAVTKKEKNSADKQLKMLETKIKTKKEKSDEKIVKLELKLSD